MSQISLPWQPGSVVAEFVRRHSIARSRKPPTRRKHPGDISHTRWVIAHFDANFVTMATRDGRDRICVTSFNSPTKNTLCWMEKFSEISRMQYNPSYRPFCLKFRCHGNGVFLLQLVWHHLITWSPKPVRRKHIGHISYTSRVIYFVAVATGVGRGRIYLARTLNSPTPKTPCWTQRSPRYLVYKPTYSRFCPKFFVATATEIGRSRICQASFNSLNQKSPCYVQSSWRYLLYRPSYRRFCPKFRCHGNRSWSQ